MPNKNRLPSPATTASLITQRTRLRPKLGLVLGSGFGAIAEAVTVEREFPYRDLPGFPVGTVPGHAGRLIIGEWHGIPVALLAGRAHYYEGFELVESTFSTRVLAALGVQTLLLTNAAGGINAKFGVGDFMALTDHINFMGANPLRGPEPAGLNRFVDLTAAYEPTLRAKLKQAAKVAGVKCHEGVYLAVSGPSFETPAEIRAFRTLGADAVGMSTVPEAIVARQCGLKVAGVSCITNAAAGLGGKGQVVSHIEVLELAKQRESVAVKFVGEFVRRAM
ncbi:MAG TPA: purine-nucleoside phosphorylase [Candidatus Limnocylindria bacterium]|nr:purine-nucleoside phosphorylase [Candidatus Limnocylindria bacterium]